ncbi:MAG: fibronectin type III domain-containing protein [Opitutaceae bacterium]|nr:fibronectin type III domain-containing protein [Cytophagales bacterium]
MSYQLINTSFCKSVLHSYGHTTLKRQLCFFMFLLLCSFQGIAQFTYPVETRMVVTQPYPSILSDFGSPGKVTGFLTLNDPNRSGLKVKVRLHIVSNDQGVSIITKPNRELIIEEGLSAGIPYPLTNISSLFNLNDLDIKPVGLLNNGGKLPEGMYFFNLEVFEAVSGKDQVLSNTRFGSQMVWITINEPPFLNFPVNNKTIVPIIPQNIVFQWTPRHIQSLNSSEGVSYNFYLVQVGPGQNANQAMQSNTSPRLEIKGLPYPYYNYSQLDFILKEGNQYAWQVQVISNGKDEFKYNGLSEVFSFYYLSLCPKPSLPAIVQGTIADLKWSAALNISADNATQSYSIQYRFSGSSSAWQIYSYDVNSQSGSQNFTQPLNMLEAGKSYDVQIKTVCKINESDPVYAGTAKNEKLVSCENGPQQLMVKDDPDKPGQKIIKWNPVEGASSYKIKRENAPDWTTEFTNSPDQYSYSVNNLPVYIRVDAVCDGKDMPGLAVSINAATNGLQGTCSIPQPLGFKAGDLGLDNKVAVEWRTGDIYENYIFSYRKKGLTSEADWTTKEGKVLPFNLDGTEGETYEYKIKFVCGTNNEASTQNALFQVLRPQAVITDPTTGSCFPPAHISSEVSEVTKCDLVCDKVEGAKSYEVAYTIKGSENWNTSTSSKPKFQLTSLTPNTSYVYKIRAVCTDGNSIYSDTASFVTVLSGITGNCEKIVDFDTVSTTAQDIILKWEAKNNYSSYAVLYHDVSEDVTAWHNLTVNKASVQFDTAVIRNLKPARTYEIQVQAYCGTDKANKSIVKNYITRNGSPLTTDNSFYCGADPDLPRPGTPCNKVPQTNDYFQTGGGFQILVSEPGKGAMVLPYMDNALVQVEFAGVMLDSKNIMCKGRVWVKSLELNVIGFGNADKIKAFMAKVGGTISDLESIFDDADNAIDEGDQYVNGGANVGNVKTGNSSDPDVVYNGTISSVTYDKNTSKLSINGTAVAQSNTPPFVVQEKGGSKSTYQVGADGIVTEIGKQGSPLSKTDTIADFTKGKIVFDDIQGSKFAFDSCNKALYKGKITVIKEYQNIGSKDFPYYVPAKAITPKETDKVTAILSGVSDVSKISFITGKGMVCNSKFENGRFTVTLLGGPASDAQEVYAIYTNNAKKVTLGKLLLPSYAPQLRKLVLVSICDTRITEGLREKMQAGLDNTYGRIGINYFIDIDETFKNNQEWDDGKDCVIQAKGSNIISNNYAGEEKALIDTYKSKKTIDGETAYLFVKDEISKSNDLLGKMPRGDHFGFLFTGSGNNVTVSDEVIKRTSLHELGHGVHLLEHTFDPATGLPQGGTTNVMDYSAGSSLYKYQWDRIFDPGHVIGVLDKDADALAVKGDLKGFLEQIKSAVEEGKNIKVPTSFSSQVMEQENILFSAFDYLFSYVSLEFVEFGKEFIFNPANYDKYVDIGIVYDNYEIHYNDPQNNIRINIILDTEYDLKKMIEYLYGKCNYFSILKSIHNASVANISLNINFLSQCSYIDDIENQMIDNVSFKKIYTSFSSIVPKGSSVYVNPKSDYQTTSTGFQIFKSGNKVFTINYFDNIITPSEYNKRKVVLENWLFKGAGAIETEVPTNLFVHNSTREYGWLSATQESGSSKGCALGYDSKGGCSYGNHQIACKTGTLGNFITWLNSKTNNQYDYFTKERIDATKDATTKALCQACEFTVKWMELCTDESFNEWQHNYILESHYKPVENKILGMFSTTELFKNMNGEEKEALVEMCVSLGVQHGGAFRIFEMALLHDYTGCSEIQNLDPIDAECSPASSDFPAKNNKNQTQISTMKETANTITMEQFIDRVYAARKLYIKANNVPDWKSIIKNRYKNEPILLKQNLGWN